MAEDLQISNIQTEEDTTSHVAAFLTAGLFIFAIVTIFLATRWLWGLPWGSGTRQIVVCFFNGMLLSIPILIALWTVMGTQNPLVRIPLATTALVALLAAYSGTLFTIPNALPGNPSEVFFLFGGITLAITITAHIPLWMLRLMNGVVIGRKKTGFAKTQFSIKHLFVATTVFALLIPMLQWLATLGENGRGVSVFLERETLAFCGIFLLVLTLLTLFSVVIVFLPKLRIWGLILLVLAVCILPCVVPPSIQYVIGRTYTWDQIVDTALNVASFSLANSLTMIIVLGLYYQFGFRLQRATT